MRSISGFVRVWAVPTGLLLILSLPALAQSGGHDGPPPGGGATSPDFPQGGTPGGMQGGGFPPDDRRGPPPMSGPHQGPMSTMRGGLQLGPPGRWWDDRRFSRELGLRPDQQKRMDTIFDSNKSQLVGSFQALRQEEEKMEGLSHAQTLDEATLFAQIDRVTQARANLEKANTHFLLMIRKEMDPDQIARLEQHR